MTCYSLVVMIIVGLFIRTLYYPITPPRGITVEQTQALKSITCLYIVIGHIGKVIEQPRWFRALGSFARIDVGIFFFISGYGLAYGYHRKPNYFKMFPKRLCNVVIPFLASISYEIYLYHGLFIDGFRSSRLYIQNDIFMSSLCMQPQLYLALGCIMR